MTKAFVLGNGRSRLNVNPKKLRQFGKIYGCNALYREFDPDCLIAVDPKMIVEICQKGYQKKCEVWTNPNSKYGSYEKLNFFKNPRGWSSGPTALLKACIDGHREIFILGFDYYGIGNNFNNVYADTFNYKKSTDTATYYGNWLRQTEIVMREYPDRYFIRILDTTTKPITEFNQLNNFRHITYDDLRIMLPGV
jgi:hypothetical protein